MKNGNLKTYAAWLPQKSWLPLILDVINVEGRCLITDFGTSHINMATAATGKLSSMTLCFTVPEAILGNKKPTKEFDIWSLGCLFYETLSRKSPYYQYKLEAQIINALNNKELPKRPGTDDDDAEEEDEYDWPDHDYDTIDDQRLDSESLMDNDRHVQYWNQATLQEWISTAIRLNVARYAPLT
ncbi:Cyclin-dependent kinase 2 [Leucoagaricus sp. SymC.cos]|nr:Cyclin-dependent kinase 2 [Leucoagaricus sp. SymC.cos]